MKNVNYNLVKLLHSSLDNHWRLEKHYLGDAKGVCPSCEKLLKEMHKDLARHIESLKRELGSHTQSGLE